MSLQCNMSLNVNTCVAGASPAPMATLTVYNPNAVPVAVTAVQLKYFNAVTLAPIVASVAPSMPAVSPGQVMVAPALSSITFGPFPVSVGSASSANIFEALVTTDTAYTNQQRGQSPQLQMLIGADVYASDGSLNDAGRVGIMVSFNPPPPATYQGGYLSLSVPANFVTSLVSGVL